MTHPMEPLVLDQPTPAGRGEAHGETWRTEIRELAAIRLALTREKGRMHDEAQILDVAARHLPVLHAIAPDLHQELLGIARGAELAPERVVVLNQYTDLRDIDPDLVGSNAAKGRAWDLGDPGGCTAIHVSGPSGPILAQTWDMHASAEPFVRMIRVSGSGGRPEALCFTLTGCLGMAGLGGDGVAVTINNLTSTDARVGLLWPAVVRRLLAAPSASEALRSLLAAPLSSGHHYMIGDSAEFFGVETSGRLKVLTQRGIRAAHIHTNHYFDPVLRKYEAVSRVSTTFRRLDLATDLYVQQQPATAEEVWSFLHNHEGFPRSICSHVDDADGDPSASKTCGLIVMELAQARMTVARGCSDLSDALSLRIDRVDHRPSQELP